MAEVKMSLEEYDALKSELEFLRRVVEEITTPVVDTWYLDYLEENGKCYNHHAKCSFSNDVKSYLEEHIMSRTPVEYNNCNWKVTPNLDEIQILNVEYINPDQLSETN